MTRRRQLADVVFTTVIPRGLDAGVLYVSIEYATAIHSCMCGCGREVVTPFGRGSWRICYDGEGISLSPSVGNGALPCRSHYFIRDSRIIWLDAEAPRSVPEPRSLLWRLLRRLRKN
ncbi:DUF6527 family protein [Protaetiibacter larvae]|uniref:Uncharacterized protein n=1 Tax=Protaetiibacter larvae TaxID=2592654 RepID=A0A5C1YAS0_9MICO|nr:DUF6527 family protein [Protaetiibacter larvae]QEO09937.1 hypothetical protein FLP23_07925 [Protaetiibacter larvae]